MKRIDGFIDIDELLKLKIPEMLRFERYEKLIERLKNVPNFNVVKSETNYHYDNPLFVLRFEINGRLYYFKQDLASIPYYELVAEEIAHDLNLKCVSYDLAKLGRYNGVISENFKQDGAKYIMGEKLLKDFYKHNSFSLNSHNNLMNIWHVLETRYKDRNNMQEIVQNLMNGLVKLLIFDMITGQNDRHCGNWGIVEYQDGRVELQPIFDNSRMFLKLPSSHRLELTTEDDNYYLEDVLTNLYNVSTDEVKSFLLGSLWVINEDNIDNIIRRVEKKIACDMPDNIKNGIKANFREQYDFMFKIISSKELNK